MVLPIVVLPHPDSPTIPRVSPGLSLNEISSTVSSNTTNINADSNTVAQTNTKIGEIQNKVTQTTTDVSSLQTRMTTAESNIAANGSIINTVKNSVYTTDQTDKLLQTYKQGSRNYIRNGNFRGAIRNSTTVPYWSWWDRDGLLP